MRVRLVFGAVLGSLALVMSAELASGGNCAPATAPVVAHNVLIKLEPGMHRIALVDTMAVPFRSVCDFLMSRGIELTTQQELLPVGTVNQDSPWKAMTGRPDSTGDFVTRKLPPSVFSSPSAFPNGLRRFVIGYTGTFLESTKDVVFTRENVGREIRATISDEGIYLASEAAWLPTFKDALITTRLTIDTPAGIEPMTNGVRVSHEVQGDRLITVWEEKNPVDGVALIAGKYTVSEARAGDVDASVWLLQDDPKLAATYLERTQAYITMYDRMIGPYPFGKFATVENWFPTGYGFPSWTLLGGAVMRLPFIPTTSFGHEVCHNWWGNSVFVAEEGGNWCEGLTSYCADYHYKEQESPAAAREYRRNLLKDYAAYVRHPEKDLPLTQFKERHSGATRAIGYGKSMMVFHMVDRSIGRGNFEQALRDVYAAKKFQRASWDDFFAAFAKSSGRDFGAFEKQWLTRTGAPTLTLRKAERQGDGVYLELHQEAPPYALDVPIVATTDKGAVVDTSVHLEAVDGAFNLKIPGAVTIAVDPDCHLFRRLDPSEIEPTISQVLGEESPLFVLPAAMHAAALAFAKAFTESESPMTVEGGRPPADVPRGAGVAKALINPERDALDARLGGSLKNQITLAGDLAFVGGKRFDLKANDLVFAAADPQDSAVTDLVVICRSADRLPGLASRIGHYGKYSYLVLPAAKGEVVRGNWSLEGGPLTARLAR